MNLRRYRKNAFLPWSHIHHGQVYTLNNRTGANYKCGITVMIRWIPIGAGQDMVRGGEDVRAGAGREGEGAGTGPHVDPRHRQQSRELVLLSSHLI
jgi:hypothetical protein